MKSSGSHAKTWILPLALMALCGATGCPVSKTVKTGETEILVTKDARKEDLLAAYNKMAAGITALNISMDLIPTAGKAYSGVAQQYHEVSGFILARRPSQVRMIGQVLSKNIFDMTSDAETFHIFIPSKNKFMVGPATLERPAEKPIENIRPQHLLDALFWPEISSRATVVMEEDDEVAARYYVLSVLAPGTAPEIERNLWFDRSDLHLARIQIYASAGKLMSDIHLDTWQPAGPSAGTPTSGAGGIEFPRHIVLQRPRDDYKLEIKIKKVTLNEPISDDRFQLQQPAGSELVKVGEPGAGKQE